MENTYKGNIYKIESKRFSKNNLINALVILLFLLFLLIFSKLFLGFFNSSAEILSKYSAYYVKGLLVTISLSLISVVLGSIFGLFLYLMKASEIKSLKIFASAYLEIVRGTPMITQIFFIFFGLASLVDFKKFGISISTFAYITGVIAVSLNSAAYVAEIIRSGINAIETGQMEAARSLGMKKSLAMEEVILPQATKNILPALGNEFIAVIKETSIISTIGVTDIMYNINLVRGASYKSLEPLILGSLLYFAITFSLTRLLKFLEGKYDKNWKSAKILWR